MRVRLASLLATAPILAGVLQAQTLDVRSTPFAEPRLGHRARHGEVVLGRTTLAATRRMFAELLNSDSIKVARGHQGNPSPTPPGTVWQVAEHRVQPHYRLDLGPERYALYFDRHEHLIAAVTQNPPGVLTTAQLIDRYPSLQKGRRWYSGDQPRSEQWTVALDACVTLVAGVRLHDARVEQLSYVYTCPTQEATQRD